MVEHSNVLGMCLVRFDRVFTESSCRSDCLTRFKCELVLWVQEVRVTKRFTLRFNIHSDKYGPFWFHVEAQDCLQFCPRNSAESYIFILFHVTFRTLYVSIFYWSNYFSAITFSMYEYNRKTKPKPRCFRQFRNPGQDIVGGKKRTYGHHTFI